MYVVVCELYWKENEKLKPLASLVISYPVNAAFFWAHVAIGKDFRKDHLIYELEFTTISSINWYEI